MTQLTKKEWNEITKETPNPLWIIVGTFIGVLFMTIIALGMVWLIKVLVQAIF